MTSVNKTYLNEVLQGQQGHQTLASYLKKIMEADQQNNDENTQIIGPTLSHEELVELNTEFTNFDASELEPARQTNYEAFKQALANAAGETNTEDGLQFKDFIYASHSEDYSPKTLESESVVDIDDLSAIENTSNIQELRNRYSSTLEQYQQYTPELNTAADTDTAPVDTAPVDTAPADAAPADAAPADAAPADAAPADIPPADAAPADTAADTETIERTEGKGYIRNVGSEEKGHYVLNFESENLVYSPNVKLHGNYASIAPDSEITLEESVYFEALRAGQAIVTDDFGTQHTIMAVTDSNNEYSLVALDPEAEGHETSVGFYLKQNINGEEYLPFDEQSGGDHVYDVSDYANLVGQGLIENLDWATLEAQPEMQPLVETFRKEATENGLTIDGLTN